MMCTNGIEIIGGNGNRVSDVVVDECFRGILVTGSFDARVSSSYAQYAEDEGVRLRTPPYTVFTSVTSRYNDGDGFDQDFGYMTAYNSCRAYSNGGNGIEIDSMYYFQLQSCQTYSNDEHGLTFSDHALYGMVKSCTANNNTRDGVHVRTGATPIQFTGCSGTGNGDENRDDDYYPGTNTYTNCTFP